MLGTVNKLQGLEHYGDIIAKYMMKIIMYDNGAVNRLEKEKYPQKHVKAIRKAAEVFFDHYPELCEEDFFEEICAGERGELEEKYSHYIGFENLDNALNNYFDEL